jgi:quercetin dioxygenase-like cupin family protein
METKAMETIAAPRSLSPSPRDIAPHVLHVPRGAGEQLWVVGDTYTYKVTASETGGRLFAWEAEIPPEAGPPPHIHQAQLEAYYVLEGELTVIDGARTLTARAGDFLYIPPGAVHAFRNTGTRPARMLIWMSPAGFEDFFREVGTPAILGRQAPAPSEEELARTVAAAPRFGLELRLSGD